MTIKGFSGGRELGAFVETPANQLQIRLVAVRDVTALMVGAPFHRPEDDRHLALGSRAPPLGDFFNDRFHCAPQALGDQRRGRLFENDTFAGGFKRIRERASRECHIAVDERASPSGS